MKPKFFKLIGIAVLFLAYVFLALRAVLEFLLLLSAGYILLLLYTKSRKINKFKKIGIGLALLGMLLLIGITIGIISLAISPLMDSFHAIVAKLLVLSAAFLGTILGVLGLIIYRMGQKKGNK